MKYIVKIPVYEVIEIEINANSEEEAKDKAILKAIETQPKVNWLIDDEGEFIINEIEVEK